ncbi:hypothetical protein [Fictibacillus sp. UD]
MGDSCGTGSPHAPRKASTWRGNQPLTGAAKLEKQTYINNQLVS